MKTEKANRIETIGRATGDLRQLVGLVAEHGADAAIVDDWIDANERARQQLAGITVTDCEQHAHEMHDQIALVQRFVAEEKIELPVARMVDAALALVRNDTWPAVRGKLAQWALEERKVQLVPATSDSTGSKPFEAGDETETGDDERDGNDPGEGPAS